MSFLCIFMPGLQAHNQNVASHANVQRRILPVAHRKKERRLHGHSHLTAEKVPEGRRRRGEGEGEGEGEGGGERGAAGEGKNPTRSLRRALKVGRVPFSMQSGPWAVPRPYHRTAVVPAAR